MGASVHEGRDAGTGHDCLRDARASAAFIHRADLRLAVAWVCNDCNSTPH
jgi:hypothetical protein